LKPFFVIGCLTTATSFLACVLRIHFLWRPRILARRLATFFAILSLSAALLATLSLILLSIVDTYRFHKVHIPLLYTFCATMLISATFTALTERRVRPSSSLDESEKIRTRPLSRK
jgi:hypothetical protein